MLTEDEIVDDLLVKLSEEDKVFVRTLSSDNLGTLHHNFGMFIRNEYGLWRREWTPELRDGCDYSPDHPDQISQRIIVKLHQKLND